MSLHDRYEVLLFIVGTPAAVWGAWALPPFRRARSDRRELQSVIPVVRQLQQAVVDLNGTAERRDKANRLVTPAVPGALAQLVELRMSVDSILRQVTNNGGKSMKDSADKAVELVGHLDTRVGLQLTELRAEVGTQLADVREHLRQIVVADATSHGAIFAVLSEITGKPLTAFIPEPRKPADDVEETQP